MEERGWFWIEGAEENRVRGVFSAEDAKKPEATLEGEVVDDPRLTVTHTAAGETSTAISGVPAKIVEAFAPVVLHGQLDSGEPVTLLRAQNHGAGLDGSPHYVAPTAVIGAHVSDDQLYSAVRFQLNAPAWVFRPPDSAPHSVPDDNSVLRTESSDEGAWLVYEPLQPISRHEMDTRVLTGCRTLARLALDPKVGIQAAEVREDGADEWRRLHSPAWSEPIVGNVHPLLGRGELTVERFANWIGLNDNLDGLGAAVAEPVKGTLQTQVLVVTSLVEGLHRRLDVYQQSRFPGADKKAVNRVRKAAREGAKAQAEREDGIAPEAAGQAVMDAVTPLGDVNFSTRVQDVIDEVTRAVPEAVPELAESAPKLAKIVKDARNQLAHHLQLDEAKEPLARRYDRWTVVAYTTPWLLRLLLLLHAGVDPAVLRRACLDDQRFGLYRENVASIARDLGWLPRSTEP